MLFTSTPFLFLFLPILFLVYYNPVFKSRKWKNILLLIFSLAFYGWGEPVFVFLMIISIFVTWLAGKKIGGKHEHKWVLVIGVVYHVIVLFVFKYLSFLSKQYNLVTKGNHAVIDIALPIGISFFTFQLMSYLFDVYYGKTKVQENLLYLGLYVSFFPQLIAGPIVRYSTIEQQIENRSESKNDIVMGVRRFIYGLGKKLLIADYMASIADYSFNSIGRMSVALAWIGALAYTLQIYFDFSGYSDMAIGLGRIFGFKFDENFNYPYISKSVTEFWRRWHISLSTWFRDYVYIPLGGNRVGKAKWGRNFFLVWLLTGIWHGANWTFVVWGLVYFAFLMIEKLTNINKILGKTSHLFTMLVVTLNWVIFRADNLTQAGQYLGNMVGLGAKGGTGGIEILATAGILFTAAIVGATPIVKNLFAYMDSKKMGWVEDLWLMVVFYFSLIHAVAATYTPFIYFNF